MTFTTKLNVAQEKTSSVVCVGLDPIPDRLPEHMRGLPVEEAVTRFCASIIEATVPVACAYKPNLAFFEALGRSGLSVLADVVAAIPNDRIIIADGKRGDIGSSAERYAEAAFETLGCDACTVSAYMGREAMAPFLQHEDKAAFALVRTSNPGADEIQELDIEGRPLYMRVAEMAAGLGQETAGSVGFVVGATRPGVLASIRAAFPLTPLLIPGIGAQGGDPHQVALASNVGKSPVMVNASRSIIYAGSGADYADRAFEAANAMRKQLIP